MRIVQASTTRRSLQRCAWTAGLMTQGVKSIRCAKRRVATRLGASQRASPRPASSAQFASRPTQEGAAHAVRGRFPSRGDEFARGARALAAGAPCARR
eukprot:175983-Pleurochrysis_carterae.AAC.1